MKVLIAEEQDESIGILRNLLEKNRFLVDIVHTGEDALAAVADNQYDVIVLDVDLPGMEGFKVLNCIRKFKITTPVLLLKSRARIEERVAGLEAGADDYLSKPFSVQEFLARIKALSRRSNGYTDPVLQFGDVILDCNCYEMSKGSDMLRLNNKEYQLAKLFMQYPHHIFSTEHLLNNIWGNDTGRSADVVWTHIGYLRKKFKSLEAGIGIRTIRGAGYSLEEI